VITISDKNFISGKRAAIRQLSRYSKSDDKLAGSSLILDLEKPVGQSIKHIESNDRGQAQPPTATDADRKNV